MAYGIDKDYRVCTVTQFTTSFCVASDEFMINYFATDVHSYPSLWWLTMRACAFCKFSPMLLVRGTNTRLFNWNVVSKHTSAGKPLFMESPDYSVRGEVRPQSYRGAGALF